MNIPIPLHCLTLQHIIDDPDAVEGYLAEHSEAERCFPIALRAVFFGADAAWDLPECKRIPSAQTTLNYLRALWVSGDIFKIAKFGLAYLVPYSIRRGEYLGGDLKYSGESLTAAVIMAAEGGHTQTVRTLLSPEGRTRGASARSGTEISHVVQLSSANNHVETTLFLINADSDSDDAATWALAGARTIPMVQAILATRPGTMINMKRLRKITYPNIDYAGDMNWWIDKAESGRLDKNNPSFAWLIRYALDHGLTRE